MRSERVALDRRASEHLPCDVTRDLHCRTISTTRNRLEEYHLHPLSFGVRGTLSSLDSYSLSQDAYYDDYHFYDDDYYIYSTSLEKDLKDSVYIH